MYLQPRDFDYSISYKINIIEQLIYYYASY